jgi:DNA (cytosine-5)-methyltransferase 1
MTSGKKPIYNVVDLFAGAGGLSYGFLQTGRFKIKAAFENNLYAQQTYKRNHSDALVCNDVADVLTADMKKTLGSIDVVIGGPPCQGFSNANRQKNHAINQNNSLVKKFVQAVLHLDPTAFVMENVSTLPSETHRFFIDRGDKKTIEKYNITTAPAEISLLDSKYVFDGVSDIVSSIDSINRYLWDEKEYLSLNVIYKYRNNKEKLEVALKKHKKKLLSLVDTLSQLEYCTSDSILREAYISKEAIKMYFSKGHADESAKSLCKAIEPTIMFQRMLSKAKEIYDNEIVVSEYVCDRDLVAKVTSMTVIDYIESILGASSNGYSIAKGVLSAASFGVPQKRMRFVIMGIKREKAHSIKLPEGPLKEDSFFTVEDAIKDLENIETTLSVKRGNEGQPFPAPPENISDLGKQLRNSNVLYNHVSTQTTPEALERFKAIKQGGNFHDLPNELKSTYSDGKRTQNTIYLRLRYDEPSGTVVNVRKSMWIHPVKHRALSIREAARLQTFPDSFVFCGTKNCQYQQVGNAVPPILARAIAEHLCEYLDAKNIGHR